MKRIKKERDDWGQLVIYVGECDRFEYEDPEIPINPIPDLHNPEFAKIYDIIDAVEDYYNNSGE